MKVFDGVFVYSILTLFLGHGFLSRCTGSSDCIENPRFVICASRRTNRDSILYLLATLGDKIGTTRARFFLRFHKKRMAVQLPPSKPPMSVSLNFSCFSPLHTPSSRRTSSWSRRDRRERFTTRTIRHSTIRITPNNTHHGVTNITFLLYHVRGTLTTLLDNGGHPLLILAIQAVDIHGRHERYCVGMVLHKK